ncbi:NBAS subunit of NRZ tethering complex [Brachyhypopomus gauderio]|uniref:NBAS subunit of NRZ tethering complex n=1 Tax=Brachyhypopomus gauderio TaxID=698409 RepID=UPI004041175D
MCRTLYPTKHKLDTQCISYISSMLLNGSFNLAALKLMAESRDERLLKLTLDQIRGLSSLSTEVYDPELLTLLLNADLLVSCVDTVLYPALVSHMLTQGSWDVDRAARDLHAAGHASQAGSLLLAQRGTHPATATFNTALAVVRTWL